MARTKAGDVPSLNRRTVEAAWPASHRVHQSMSDAVLAGGPSQQRILANDRDKVPREESSQFPELIGLVVVAVPAE